MLKSRKFAIWLTIIIKDLKFWSIQAIKTKTTFFTNHWKLYPSPTNHLRFESFFFQRGIEPPENDNYLPYLRCLKVEIKKRTLKYVKLNTLKFNYIQLIVNESTQRRGGPKKKSLEVRVMIRENDGAWHLQFRLLFGCIIVFGTNNKKNMQGGNLHHSWINLIKRVVKNYFLLVDFFTAQHFIISNRWRWAIP
ncbi:hypothetical protein AGLY_014538 [Aphis glycines]|uniref:Uncharacterized protein n=1 Tax=Aphis glycines TaxID=307491 RepID=A0A6G0T4K0_APHGL|nr:hypothetical protein AGLY_014538 [Aphis glycines]